MTPTLPTLTRTNHKLNDIETQLHYTEAWLSKHPSESQVHDRHEMIQRRHFLHAEAQRLHDELICAD